MELLIIKVVFGLISITLFLYSLSKLPKKIDFNIIWKKLKRNFFRYTTIILLLYSVWLTYIHEKSKDTDNELRAKYYETKQELLECVENKAAD